MSRHVILLGLAVCLATNALASFSGCDTTLVLQPEFSKITSIARCSWKTFDVQDNSKIIQGNHTVTPGNLRAACQDSGYCGTSLVVNAYDASTTYVSTAVFKAFEGPFEIDQTTVSSSLTTPPPQRPRDGDSGFIQCGGLGPYEDCSPIVINFEGGYELSGADIWFDIAGIGTPVLIGWTAAESDEAFLWMDRNGNDTVDGGGELFGTATRLTNGQRASNGFDVLRELDSNGDSVLDARDADWPALRLWRDANHNGLSEAVEISLLSASNVTAFDLRYHWSGRRDPHGNRFKYESLITLSHGSATKPVYDIFFVGGSR